MPHVRFWDMGTHKHHRAFFVRTRAARTPGAASHHPGRSRYQYRGSLCRVFLPGIIALIGDAILREQTHHVLQGAQVSVRPVAALLGAFFQVLLFRQALRGFMLDPLSKLAAAILYLSKL